MNDKNSLIRDSSVWQRLLYMLLFVIAYSVVETILTAIVLIQILFRLFSGKTNPRLLAFSAEASRYIYDVLQYLTFNSEEKPFPFRDWPSNQAA